MEIEEVNVHYLCLLKVKRVICNNQPSLIQIGSSQHSIASKLETVVVETATAKLKCRQTYLNRAINKNYANYTSTSKQTWPKAALISAFSKGCC